MKKLLTLSLSVAGPAALYLYLVAPRRKNRPDRSPFLGVHYAHRGLFDNQSDAPENSLAAYKKAVAAGYGIELDVQLSKDGIPVVFHDASLKRMCGTEGNVWDYTLAELKEMRLADSQECIPAFSEALKTIDGKVPLIVEYKLDVVNTTVCIRGNRLLKAYRGPYCIESFHPRALRWYRKHRPDVLRGQLAMDFKKDKGYYEKPGFFILSHLLTNVLTRPDFIAFRHTDASSFSRRVCRRLGALSVAWTIKNQEQYEAAKDNFDLFIFDSFLLRPAKTGSKTDTF